MSASSPNEKRRICAGGASRNCPAAEQWNPEPRRSETNGRSCDLRRNFQGETTRPQTILAFKPSLAKVTLGCLVRFGETQTTVC